MLKAHDPGVLGDSRTRLALGSTEGRHVRTSRDGRGVCASATDDTKTAAETT
jgi:hypothetical protein